jgi:hypothetical protein
MANVGVSSLLKGEEMAAENIGATHLIQALLSFSTRHLRCLCS